MAKIQITLTLEPTALYPYHRPDTGLTVYAKNASLNSGVDQLLTESGVSGVYKNASVDAGAYEVWIGGTQYPQFEPLVAEEISKAGLKDDSVTEDQILDGSVTVNKIGALAVSTAKIAALAVSTAKIALLAITEGLIAAGAVTETKIGALAVSLAKIKADAYAEVTTPSVLVLRNSNGDVQGAINRASEAQELNTTIGGAISRKFQNVVATGMNGNATFDITFTDTAAGDKVLGILLRVNVALGQDWKADYKSEPSTQSIAGAGQGAAVNTKISRLYDADADNNINEIGNTLVTITADSGTFTAGSMQAVLFYETLTELENYSA